MVYTFVPTETLGAYDDDGTIVESVATLGALIVGHRIVKVENPGRLTITLDTGLTVELGNNDDCCAYTELESFLWNADKIDHVITGVSTSNGYTTWSIYADMGDVLSLQVGWSAGNPFYYGYGFNFVVTPPEKKES
jgi:hypothetical protein